METTTWLVVVEGFDTDGSLHDRVEAAIQVVLTAAEDDGTIRQGTIERAIDDES